MTLTMVDGVTVADMPSGHDAYAGYVGGNDFTNFAEVVAIHHKTAHCFSIAARADYTAECLDVEPGCAQVSDVLPWYGRMKAKGIYRPCFYAAEFEDMPAVRSALAHVPRGDYRLWVADQNGEPHIPAGYDACQYDGSAEHPGLHYDISLLAADFFPEHAHKPKPPHPHGLLDVGLSYNLETHRFGVAGAHRTPGAVMGKGTARARIRVDKHTGEWHVRRGLLRK
jgi:hypothetical protein